LDGGLEKGARRPKPAKSRGKLKECGVRTLKVQAAATR